MKSGVPGRPGPALVAFAVIMAVTAAWWALALAPVAAATVPEWVVRTRLACFGAPPGGLPNAGGWVLLVCQPIGMLSVLVVVWRDALSSDLRWVLSHATGRVMLGLSGVALGWGLYSAVVVVRGATGERFDASAGDSGDPVVVRPVPLLSLTDQNGEAFRLDTSINRPVLVTFAYAHCADICPTLVQGVLRARSDAGRPEIPIVVVTVDPWRDVPSRLGAIAAAWGLGPGDRLLGGTVQEVTKALSDWGIGHRRNPETGEILHATTVLVVEPRNRSAVRIDGSLEQLVELLGKA